LVSCHGVPGIRAATGQLVADTTQPNGVYRYLLPISTEFVPALGQVTGTANVEVSAAATDAAGNVGTLLRVATFKFALDAPPMLAIREDTSFAGSDHGRSRTSGSLTAHTTDHSLRLPYSRHRRASADEARHL